MIAAPSAMATPPPSLVAPTLIAASPLVVAPLLAGLPGELQATSITAKPKAGTERRKPLVVRSGRPFMVRRASKTGAACRPRDCARKLSQRVSWDGSHVRAHKRHRHPPFWV